MPETGPPRRRLALVDRDGTIIIDKVYLADPDGIEFAPSAIEGLRLLRDAGFALVLITNQSGIARGLFDVATLDRIHDRLKSMLAAEGLELEAVYFCPHGPDDGCDCRKPKPGMLTNAMRDLGSWSSATATPIWGRLKRRASPGCGSPPAAGPLRAARRLISSKPRAAPAPSSRDEGQSSAEMGRALHLASMPSKRRVVSCPGFKPRSRAAPRQGA